MTKTTANVFGGMFFVRESDGRLHQTSPGTPDRVIARRLRDFPDGMPDGAAVTACDTCGCAVVTETVFPNAPRTCLQCSGIEPLPFPKADQ